MIGLVDDVAQSCENAVIMVRVDEKGVGQR